MSEPKTPVTWTEPAPGLFWFHPPDGGEVYFLECGGSLVMVDSGMPRHRETLLAAVREAGLDPDAIGLGIVSHCHCDHCGAMGWWRERFGFDVVAHELARQAVETGDPVVTGASMPYAGFNEPFIPCPVSRTVRGGERRVVGDREFVFVSAPGHTPGGLHLLTRDAVFVGDNLFANGSIGWMDVHWGSNPEDYVETLERLRVHCGKLACAGHGAPFILEAALINRARDIAAFYIPPAHGLGMPRAASLYGKGT